MNGFIKIWRKEQASEIWDQPPELYKLWHWILLNVNYETGIVERTSAQIMRALKMPAVDHRNQLRRLIKWLEGHSMITAEVYGSGMQRGYRITVLNWEKYQAQECDENVTRNVRERDEQSIVKEHTYGMARDENVTRNVRERDSSQEGRRKKEENYSHTSREARVSHSVYPEPDFVPDPTFSPNAILTHWKKVGLPLPRSIHELEQENQVRKLHHESPHWSRDDIQKALSILRQDYESGNNQLAWVWKNGPGDLANKKPGKRQVIEQVLNWQPFPTSSQRSGAFGHTGDDDHRSLEELYLEKRNRL